MSVLFKYAVVLVLGLAIGSYVGRPTKLDQAARFVRIDQIDILIDVNSHGALMKQIKSEFLIP